MRVCATLCALLVACGGSSSTPSGTPPVAPSSLTATGGAGKISLSWTGSAGATSYVVLRGTAPGTEANPVASAVTTFDDTVLPEGQTYYYVVQAVNSVGNSPSSNEASATTLTAPAAPTGVAVVTSDVSATVSWNAVAGAATYDVQRAPGGTTSFAPVGSTSTTSIGDSGLTPNTSYVYEVRAVNVLGASAYTTATATTAPVAPTGLTAFAANHHVILNWTDAPGAGAGGYRILRSSSSSGPFTSVGTSPINTFTDTFLINNTAYFYVVHTIGGSGESGDSNKANATPFIEICTVDGASYRVSVFDGTASGNVAPKRSFGWNTGIAEGTGIGADGTYLYVASAFTKTVNIYPRTVSGDTAPSSTIALPSFPTALTVDAANGEIYVAMGSTIAVYDITATGNATPKRTLTSSGNITGIQVYNSTTPSLHQTFVVSDNHILIYNNGDSGTTAPQGTITPSGVVAINNHLAGPAYDPTNDAIWVAWQDTSLDTSIASYARTSFGSATPVGGPITKGQFNAHLASVAPGGLLMSGTNVWITLGSATKSELVAYSRTASGGGTGPVAGFTGSNTHIYIPGPVTLDTVNSEFWFINGRNGAFAYSTSASSNTAPVRALMGDETGLYDPISLGADRGNDEIVVLNQSPGHAIAVYPRDAADPVAPARSIAGPTTTLGTIAPDMLAIDEIHAEYWVNEHSSTNGFTAFSAASFGDAAPAREITRDVSLGVLDSMYYDPVAGQILGIVNVGASSWTLSGWNRTHIGNVPADRVATLSPPAAGSPTFDPVGNRVFMVTDTNSVSAYPGGFTTGALSPFATFTWPVDGSLAAVDAEGRELYFRASDAIVVVPSDQTGTVTTRRMITGAATKLYNTVGLAICN